MPDGADVTMRGIALLIAETLEALDLPAVVLVANDWVGPQITAVERPDLIAGLVLTAKEAFDNYPPGLPGAFAALACRLPGGLNIAGRSLRTPGFQRLAMTFGRMTVRPIPRDIIRGWTEGLITEPALRRDVRQYVTTTPKHFSSRQPSSCGPSTNRHWSSGPPTTGPCHAAMAPASPTSSRKDASSKSTTAPVLMPLDRPTRLAEEIRAFAASL